MSLESLLFHLTLCTIQLSALTEDSSSRISFDTSLSFKNNTKKYRGQMRALTQLHVHLQTHGLSKHKGQLLIDNFFQSVSTFKDVHGHALEGYGIKNEHSKMGNKHETDPHFITGIDKIANKDEGSMTEAEKVSELGYLMFGSNIVSQVVEFLQVFIEI